MAATQGYKLVEMLLTAGQGGRQNQQEILSEPSGDKLAAHYIIDEQMVVLCVPEDGWSIM